MKISQVISRTTGPNKLLFVFILMHFQCCFQKWAYLLTILKFLNNFGKKRCCLLDCWSKTLRRELAALTGNISLRAIESSIPSCCKFITNTTKWSKNSSCHHYVLYLIDFIPDAFKLRTATKSWLILLIFQNFRIFTQNCHIRIHRAKCIKISTNKTCFGPVVLEIGVDFSNTDRMIRAFCYELKRIW